jgi:hypothetical protein
MKLAARTTPPVTHRTRVSDKIAEVIEYALLLRDFHSAERLIEVMENIAQRRVRRFGGERRASIDEQITALRLKVEQAKAEPEVGYLANTPGCEIDSH